MQVVAQLPAWAKPLLKPARYKSARGGRGSSKALADSTPIPTPVGWTTMGDLRVGDEVLGSDGRPTVVTAVHPQGIRPAWQIDFAFGEPIICDADHLWRAADHLWRKRRNRRGSNYADWRTIEPRSTEQLAAVQRHGTRGDLSLAIPLTDPLDLEPADLPIPPYLLGLWLGDGSSDQASLTALPADADHYRVRLAAIGEALGEPFPSRMDRAAPTYRLSPTLGLGLPRSQGLQGRLRHLGLIRNKHVPDSYLRGSITQRLDLLCGLMDTDGCIAADGREATFTSTNQQLAAAVLELVVSLGKRATSREHRARLHGRDCGPVWSIAFRPFVGCVSLPRKASRIRHGQTQANRHTTRMIRGIAPTGQSASMTCITVDADDSMFLAGRSMIPTHNSHTFAQLAVLRMAGMLPDYEPGPVRIASCRSVEVSIKESVKRVVEDYIEAYGLTHQFDIRSMWIDHKHTGAHMFFPGVSNKVESFLSMEGIDVFWMEQAETLGEEMIYVDPTIRKLGAERWFTWNPSRRTGWCYQRFVANPQPGDISLWINWHHNPWWHLTGLDETRRYWEQVEPSLYKWMWLGHPMDTDGTNTVLPYDSLKQCVEAYREGLAPDTSNMRAYAGLDLAEGGRDKCALVVRRGPVVELVERWPGVTGDMSIAAAKSRDLCGPYSITRIYYDAASPATTELRRVGFRGIMPTNFGGAVGGPDEEYEPDRTNKETFGGRNMQMADNLRLRMNRTIQLRKGNRRINPMDCLFIPPDLPNLEDLLAEWSQPERIWQEPPGHWILDKAPDDSPSPDRFDALALSFGFDTDEKGLRART